MVGCGKSKGTAASGELGEVTYVTGLGATGKESYPWVADAKGYFAAEGIKVKILLGAAGSSNLNLLHAGKADFAAIDWATAIQRAGQGQFGNIRVSSVSFSKTLVALMALTSSGIKQPGDLVGQHVAQTTGAIIHPLFRAYAGQVPLSPTDIQKVIWVDTQGSNLQPMLAAGQVDAIGLYVPNRPAVEKAAGQPVTVLPFSTYLSDLYGDVIAAPTSLSVDLRARFCRALFKGLQYAVANPDEAGDILHAAVPSAQAAPAAAGLKLLPGYVASPQADEGFVVRSIALCQSVNLITSRLDPGDVVDFRVGNALGKL